MSTVDIPVENPEASGEGLLIEQPAVPQHNAADLLLWSFKASTDKTEGEVDFVYNSHHYADREVYDDPVLLHPHSTEAWKTRITTGH